MLETDAAFTDRASDAGEQFALFRIGMRHLGGWKVDGVVLGGGYGRSARRASGSAEGTPKPGERHHFTATKQHNADTKHTLPCTALLLTLTLRTLRATRILLTTV